MAANKFATMVHRNTNKMTLILVYALLEWVLIILLLINALFSYLIVKFVDYFGLKPPCPLCSRIDHFLNPKQGKSFYRDLLCEDHASEISNLSYCLNHRKLTDSLALCQDCSCSRWRQENGEDFLCSCCGLRFDEARIEKGNDSEMDLEEFVKLRDIDGSNGFQHLEYFLGKDGFNLIPVELIDPTTDEEQHHDTILEGEADLVFEPVLVVYNRSSCFEEKETDPSACDDESTKLVILDSMEIQGNENSIGFNSENFAHDQKLVDDDGVGNQEVMAAASFGAKDESSKLVILDRTREIQENENSIGLSSENHDQDKLDDVGHQAAIAAATEKDESIQLVLLETMEIQENENSIVFNSESFDQDKLDGVVHQAAIMDAATEKEEEDESIQIVLVETMEIQEDENSIVFNSENFDQDKLDDDVGHQSDMGTTTEDESTELVVLENMEIQENENSILFNSENYDQDKQDDDVCHQAAMPAAEEYEEEEYEDEFPHMPINEIEADVSIGTDIPDLASSSSSSNSDNFHGEKDHDDHDHDHDQYEVEETIELKPISVELNEQHYFFPISIEETRNTEFKPVSSDINMNININEPDEDKVPETPTSSDSFLNRTLDGSSSVVSEAEGVDGFTSVDRLKSALRSERKALYDLYTELEEERSASAIAANQTMAMINRLQEEKAAMQMEALQYQRMMEEQSEYDQEAFQLLNELMMKRDREKQELERELDVYRTKVVEYESKEKIRRSSSSSSLLSPDPNQTTPVEDVFEGDKIQILEHLKVLEGKMLSLGDDEDEEQPNFEENGYHLMGVKGKRLLPLFDAISDENGDENAHENGYGSSSSSAKRIEVDEIYERVQALEEDREFLKNCIGSLKKGDKGMVLLREILQHLRDLKTVKNFSDGPLL